MTAFEKFDKQPKTLDNYLDYLISLAQERDYEGEVCKEYTHLLCQKSVTKYLGICLECEVVKIDDRFKLNIISPKPYTTFEV